MILLYLFYQLISIPISIFEYTYSFNTRTSSFNFSILNYQNIFLFSIYIYILWSFLCSLYQFLSIPFSIVFNPYQTTYICDSSECPAVFGSETDIHGWIKGLRKDRRIEKQFFILPPIFNPWHWCGCGIAGWWW